MQYIASRLRQQFSLPSAALFFIVLLMIFIVAVGLNELVRGVSYPSLLACGFMSAFLAWRWLSKIYRVWIAYLLLLTIGLLCALIFVDEIGSSLLSLIWNFLEALPNMFAEQPLESFTQLQQAAVRFSFTLQLFYKTLSTWWAELLAGRAGYNQQITVLVWNFVIWVMSGWLGLAIRREWNPFRVIIPILGLMTTVVAYSKASSWVLSLVMVVCFILVAFVQHFLRERQWEEKSIGYSLELRLDVFTITMLISFFIVVLTLIIPSISIRKLVDTVRELIQNEQAVDIAPAIGLYEQSEGPFGGGDWSAGVLPASQLVGIPPELGDEVVMHVWAGDEFISAVQAHPYWRSHTYEEYTGSGWLVGEVFLERFLPGEELEVEYSQKGSSYQLNFTVFDNVEKRLYHAGQVITTNKDYGAIYRVTPEEVDEKDFFAGLMEWKSYQVQIRWTSFNSQDLNSTEVDYPAWMRQRYLQLPSNLPPRVSDLAAQITQGADTPYQKTVAIEAFLRNYTYSLDVAAIPPDRDVVDYFLFDTQEGYCDYFATAMVVLARVVGLPARLVSGFASGNYVLDGGYYEVKQLDAHSWAEVYFPEFGWVKFEPTSNRPAFDRSTEETEIQPAFKFPTSASVFWKKALPRLAYILIFFLTLPLLTLMIDFIWLRSGSADWLVKVIYRRLIWFATRTKVPFKASLTPYEFSRLYRNYLTAFWARSKLAANINSQNENRLEFLTRQLVQVVYGEKQINKAAKAKITEAWFRLAPWLVFTQVRSWFQRSGFQEPVPE